MNRKYIFRIILILILVLGIIRFWTPEDTRICDGNTLVQHGHPTVSGSGFSCSGWEITDILP